MLILQLGLLMQQAFAVLLALGQSLQALRLLQRQQPRLRQQLPSGALPLPLLSPATATSGTALKHLLSSPNISESCKDTGDAFCAGQTLLGPHCIICKAITKQPCINGGAKDGHISVTWHPPVVMFSGWI